MRNEKRIRKPRQKNIAMAMAMIRGGFNNRILSIKTGLSEGLICAVLCNRRAIRRENAAAIAKALETTVEALGFEIYAEDKI